MSATTWQLMTRGAFVTVTIVMSNCRGRGGRGTGLGARGADGPLPDVLWPLRFLNWPARRTTFCIP